MLSQGRITINGKKPGLGAKVGPHDEVKVDRRRVGKPKAKHVYIAFNKPVGIVSSKHTKGQKNTIVEFINHKERIFPVGRLDKDSDGLIFLTSDGDIVNKILRSKNNHEKEYVVTVDKPLNDTFVHNMSKGIPMLGTVTDPCVVDKMGPSRRTVSTVKKSLAEKAILTWDRRFNSSNRYEINIVLLALLVSVGKVYEQWVTHMTGVTHVTEGGDEIVGRVGNNCARYGKYCNCERGVGVGVAPLQWTVSGLVI